jgi:hypothetical protein
MITKEKLLAQLETFPDNVSIDELIDRLVFIDKLENRIQESENEDVICEEELRGIISKWSK